MDAVSLREIESFDDRDLDAAGTLAGEPIQATVAELTART